MTEGDTMSGTETPGSSRPVNAPRSPTQTSSTPLATTPQPASATTTPHSAATPGSTIRSGPPVPHLVDSSGVTLGLQALERQQEEQVRKRQLPPAPPPPRPVAASALQQQPQQPVFTDDDTDPSSTPSGDGSDSLRTSVDGGQPHPIGRFIQKTRRRLSSRDANDPTSSSGPVIIHTDRDITDEDMWEAAGRPLISGYLHKFGRNGKWQKRFFESDGEALSYYKSDARTKMLATLDLCKVGTIALDHSDPSGCVFSIQVGRPYNLRAETRAVAMDWVITLNRIKEAKMQVGHVQLVPNKAHRPPGQSDEFTPRVVLVANRRRTKALDSDEFGWEDLPTTKEGQSLLVPPGQDYTDGSNRTQRIQRAVLARWQKRQTGVDKIRRRLLVWARSIKLKNSCKHPDEQVILDGHVHPPGHDSIKGTSDVSSRTDPSKASDASASARDAIPNSSARYIS